MHDLPFGIVLQIKSCVAIHVFNSCRQCLQIINKTETLEYLYGISKTFQSFDRKAINIDETSFYFRDDPRKIEHFIGFLPQYELPYWVGYCDIEGGCEFKTAKELFEAQIFDGKSIKDRWNEVEIIAIGAISIDEWKEEFCLPNG